MDFNILIIEDDILLSEELSLIISENNLSNIQKAYTSKTATELICKQEFDCIFCDINLNEDITGLDIVEEYKLWEKSQIIFLTAYNDLNTLERISKMPDVTFLNKPFNDKQILSTINILLCKKKACNDKQSTNVNFTKRESEIAQLIGKGMSNREIAELLNISRFTADNHRKNIYKKAGVSSACELLNFLINR